MGNDENNSLAWKETTVVIQRGFTKKERRGKNKQWQRIHISIITVLPKNLTYSLMSLQHESRRVLLPFDNNYVIYKVISLDK